MTSIHKESVINMQSIKAMLEVRQLNRRKIFPIQAPPLPKKLNEKSGFKDNMQSCTPAYNYTITERLLHNRIIGDEAFSPLWAKLVSYGWKSVKGKGLSSWLYARPGEMKILLMLHAFLTSHIKLLSLFVSYVSSLCEIHRCLS